MKQESKENLIYYHGKFFRTLSEIEEFAKKWPEQPCDLDYYRKFLDERFKEAYLNVRANPEVTNKTIFKILRLNTDWTE